MTQRHSMTRRLGAVGLSLSLVGMISHGTASAQTPLAETRQRADQGDADAQFTLAVSYRNGEGVPQDFTQAVAWYRRAADQGYAEEQKYLGVSYLNGEGVPQDDAQAMAWYRRAADQGYAIGQNNLGRMYI